MRRMKYLIAFGAALVAFLVIDLVWITNVVRPLYEREVPGLLRETPRIGGAVLFYLAYVAGIVLFAVRPGLAQQSVGVTLGYGAAFGALAYATFTVTNYAVLNQWTFTLVWTDIVWGATLTAVVAACGFYATRLVD